MKGHPRCGSRTAGLLALAVLTFNPPLEAEEPFDYFRNSWNVIGLRDYAQGTRITPENKLQLADGAEVRLRFGRQLTPLSREQTKQLLDGWLPIVLITAEDGPVRYEFTLWATPLPSVKGWQKAFDWPTEGENFLDWILVKAANTGTAQAEAKLKVERSGPGIAEENAFSWSLGPTGSAQAVVRIPFAPVESAVQFAKEDAKLWLQRTKQYWQDLILTAARIEVPCRKATEALLAAHVCQLIASDHGELHGGEGFYDQFYIRDGGYQIMELEEAGLWDAAAKAVDYYLRSQRPDGRFETQKDQLDANGQALWVLWQYYKITGDRQWLGKAYPQMRRAVEWTMKARREAPADSPFAGVLPNAPADGEYLWDGEHHIVGYDLWNLRGMLCTADAASELGKTDEAEELLEEAKLYRQAIDAAWKRTELAHFPPSWEKGGTHWGNTETLWPTELFDPDDPRVIAMIDHARNIHGGGGYGRMPYPATARGFIEGTIQWLGRPGAIHPYMSAYTTMASLKRGNHEQVVEDFYWYLLHSSASHAFAEGIYYKRRFAWNNTIPHVTGASNYALMLRHMLLDERGKELHLLAAVPDWWLAEGEQIRVLRAPTHFGQISFTVRGTADGVQVELEPPKRQAPERILLYLPESRPLVGALENVEVVTRSDQKKRWDLPAVIELYRQQAGPWLKPIPGLVTLPLEPALDADRCHTLELAPVANTDPFSAPFGVPQPRGSKYLFSGLPAGRQTLGGVPFRILDPANNDGRAFVVLHSPKAPKNRHWPHEVQIPVNRAGRRLFFLGNVHGWSSQDPGTGQWGAVAEYVIHYADGRTQTVPLVTGRTADEWTAPPEAEDVFAALRGHTWHLNVLGVTLRAVPVERIVFRDLGTPAAPVLVAVTLEE